MLADKPYACANDLAVDLDRALIPARAPDRGCLMVRPDHFRIDYVINPHMQDAAGRPNRIDHALAVRQWEELRRTYLSLGYAVSVLPADPALPDMVFAANQSFPFMDRDGRPAVVFSRMATAERRPEVAHFERFYAERGFRVIAPPTVLATEVLEGMGDILWAGDRRLLLAGWGFRTSRAVAERMAAIAGAPVLLFELRDPRFYHLDTAIAPLDRDRALVCRAAFTEEGCALLDRYFGEIIDVPLDEAAQGFACNAHAPDGKNVILDRGSPKTIERLSRAGFSVHALDLSEFHKSGGSVFCLKMMIP